MKTITIKTVYSNYSYLPDGRVLEPASLARCFAGPAKPESVFPPTGEWLVAAEGFHLRGGWGADWEDAGADVRAGGRFRLLSAGSPAVWAVWEVET